MVDEEFVSTYLRLKSLHLPGDTDDNLEYLGSD
jgi:hypothetical protein